VIERCVHTGQLADQGLQPDWQAVNLVDLTSTCIQSCRSPALVDLLAPQAAGLLQTDAQMLSIVLSNLLDNACKYGAPNCRIQLLLTPAIQEGQPGWRWEVSSLVGPAGLPDAGRLFEKYYRGPQARRLSGSGLGLFLVKGLLELLRGTIQFEARDAHAVFCIWLPAQPTSR
jgi:signal transduction histidine kinase